MVICSGTVGFIRVIFAHSSVLLVLSVHPDAVCQSSSLDSSYRVCSTVASNRRVALVLLTDDARGRVKQRGNRKQRNYHYFVTHQTTTVVLVGDICRCSWFLCIYLFYALNNTTCIVFTQHRWSCPRDKLDVGNV